MSDLVAESDSLTGTGPSFGDAAQADTALPSNAAPAIGPAAVRPPESSDVPYGFDAARCAAPARSSLLGVATVSDFGSLDDDLGGEVFRRVPHVAPTQTQDKRVQLSYLLLMLAEQQHMVPRRQKEL